MRVKSWPTLSLILCAAGLFAADGGAGAPAGKPAKGKGKEKDAASATDATNSGLRNFGQMIPLGSRSRGVRIPAFDSDGKPGSLIVADAMTRIDDTQLYSEKMVIQVFAEKKEEDMRIDVKTGIYNMDEQILTSEERSRVSRPDFQIEGDSMVYDTKTGQGKMAGRVEMIIFDADAAKAKMNINAGGAKTAAAAASEESPPAAPPGAASPSEAPPVQAQSVREAAARPAAAPAAKKSKPKKKK